MEEKTYSEYYDDFKDHFKKWCAFNRSNIADKACQASHEKQWIISRLHDFRRDKEILSRKINKRREVEILKKSKEFPVNLTKSTLDLVDGLPELKEMNDEMKELEFLIRYLEDMSKMMMFIAQDVKNVLEAIRVEES